MRKNVYQINPHFKWNLLKDVDDNKFIDCAVAGNVITNDKHFNVLKNVDFPPISKLTSQEFENQFRELLENN